MFSKLFDLKERVPLKEARIKNEERARGFDLVSRISMRFPMESIMKKVKGLCKPGDAVLDAGSQTGLLSLMLGGLRPDIEVFGIEEDALLYDVSEENLTLASLAQTPAKVEFHCGSLTKMPIEDNAADMVISYTPLFRVKDPVAFLKECRRVCKDDGVVFLCDMARDADEGTISFILQYVASGHKEFMQSLRASYSTDEVQQMLEEAGLGDWIVQKDAINLIITSKEL